MGPGYADQERFPGDRLVNQAAVQLIPNRLESDVKMAIQQQLVLLLHVFLHRLENGIRELRVQG